MAKNENIDLLRRVLQHGWILRIPTLCRVKWSEMLGNATKPAIFKVLESHMA